MDLLSSDTLRQLRSETESRRIQHLEEANRLKDVVVTLDRLLALLGQGAMAPEANQAVDELPLQHQPRRERVNTVKAKVEQVVRESGRPMHANEILEKLRAEGVPLSRKDPKATVVTALLRLSRAAVDSPEGVQSLGNNMYAWKPMREHEVDLPAHVLN